MAPRRSALFNAICVLLVHAPHKCSAKAAPASGRAAQTYVGPDGAPAQAYDLQEFASGVDAGVAAANVSEEQESSERPVTRREEETPTLAAAARPAAVTSAVVVDPMGNSESFADPAGTPSLIGVGVDQYPSPPRQPQWAQGQNQVLSYGSPYSSGPPIRSRQAVQSAGPMPYAVGSTAGAPPTGQVMECHVPMWGKKMYVCTEWEDYEVKHGWTDSTGNLRVKMPDGAKCTVSPPSSWMSSPVETMLCQEGVWLHEGKQVIEIACTTAVWFYVLTALSIFGLVVLVYKLKYQQDSALYHWWHKDKDPALLADEQTLEGDAAGAEPTDAQQH